MEIEMKEKKMWYLKISVVQIIVRALGRIKKRAEKQ